MVNSLARVFVRLFLILIAGVVNSQVDRLALLGLGHCLLPTEVPCLLLLYALNVLSLPVLNLQAARCHFLSDLDLEVHQSIGDDVDRSILARRYLNVRLVLSAHYPFEAVGHRFVMLVHFFNNLRAVNLIVFEIWLL